MTIYEYRECSKIVCIFRKANTADQLTTQYAIEKGQFSALVVLKYNFFVF